MTLYKPSSKKNYLLSAISAGVLMITAAGGASAFCGFYVAKADTKLFNKASKVVLMRDNDRTVITMANDYQGETERVCNRYSCSGRSPRRTNKRNRQLYY